MMETHDHHLASARTQTLRAGQWLVLLRFQTSPGAPVLLPSVTTYNDMLDPGASDAARRAACSRLLPAVERQTELERWRHEEAQANAPARDPRGREWCTTLRGAALETVADLLRAALADFATAGIAGEG